MRYLFIKPTYVSKHFSSFEEVAADEDFLAWFTGANNQQATRWKIWLAENSQYASLVDEAVHYLKSIRLSDQEVSPGQTEAAHERLMRSLQRDSVPVVKMNRAKTRWWLSAAAAVILLIAGALVWKSSGNNDERFKLNTAYGQVGQYNLPDGSEVMLNANSKLFMQKWKR